jgi:hydroxymethylbilane synthase
MPRPYIIGTRGSLLALTQCGQVKTELEKISGKKFELQIIKTQGDQIVDKPLWQLEGKDFFTKELDEKLMEKEVDLVVHSYKDLGSVRPAGIELAAVTKRQFPHDVLFIRTEIKDKIKILSTLNVGTSSPRRIVNIEKYLKDYLPKNNLKITCSVLRGNVNSRLKKLVDGEYDAIVLAMAGIERLLMDEKACAEIVPLLSKLDLMILPLQSFPSCASQGALGIECHETAAPELKQILKQMHHNQTFEEISRERKIFARYGGGCHLAVGIHVQKKNDFFVHYEQGEYNHQEIHKTYLNIERARMPKSEYIFLGMPKKGQSIDHYVYDEYIEKKPLQNAVINVGHILFTSGHTTRLAGKCTGAFWSSGMRTWKKLALLGHWISGACGPLGEIDLNELVDSRLVKQMLPFNERISLTRAGASGVFGKSVGVYEYDILDLGQEFQNKIINTKIFFWTSFSQYQTYLAKFPHILNATHACGMGKTWDQFKANNIKVEVFANIEEFKSILNSNS